MRRRRLVALAAVAALAVLVTELAAGSSSTPKRRADRARRATHHVPRPRRPPAHHAARTHSRPGRTFAVGLITLDLVDHTRVIHLAGGATVPRPLTTYVRYPAAGPARGGVRPGAPPARGAGPFPLIVFGHGFDVTPGLYAPLLDAWARAGYVVAAPVFPLAGPGAPGGPTEADLPNQPADMRFLITRLLDAGHASSGVLHGLISGGEIAVAGQSDGGDTALAVAYDPGFRDPRVRAAVILSGAEIPNLPSFAIKPGGPPLLATQGTADPINPPSATAAFYDPAPAPKYLLELLGASHLPPYSTDATELAVVARVTVDFLDRYLEHRPGALERMRKAGDAPGVATLRADP